MEIVKKILIKQIITEKSKENIRSNFQEQKMRLEQECQQLLFEKRKLQNKPGVPKQEIAHRFQDEIDRRKEEIKLIDFKEEQLELLDVGSEIVEGEVEALVEVSVGADWDEVLRTQAIVVQDNIVVRIDK
ncbi:YlqD family protein [Oceanobacillus sp. FSL H7-0719]|uniref:YlqD family protein n=1 Tax=Oceanobacillus sp. FSL H7-0719 TaxID=2954507 RepID=UPI0032464C17